MKNKKRTKSAPKVKRNRKSSTGIFSSLLIIVIIFVATITIIKLSEYIVAKDQNSFPKLEISLTSVPLEQINIGSKDTEYYDNTATFTIKNNTLTIEGVEIKGRGNSTWLQPKKPYQIKTPEKTSIFDFEPAKKWLLLANYIDPTHLRNNIAFYLERLLNEQYAMSGDYIEVYFDKNYNGLYYLTEKIELQKTRLNLKNPHGILVEFDNTYGDICYQDMLDNCLTISDSVNSDRTDTSIALFTNKLNAAESAIAKHDYKTVSNLLDIDSFVKYYILNEFSVNPDAYSTSFFLYQDGENDKIHAGPGWDFDVSFGYTGWTPENINSDFFHSPFETSPIKTFILEDTTETVSNDTHISSLFYDLMDIPEFAQRVKEIYQSTLSGKGEELLDYIRTQADYIRPAALRDQERWKLKTDFDEEVDYLIDWVAKRYSHFEEIYGANPTPDPALESPQPSTE